MPSMLFDYPIATTILALCLPILLVALRRLLRVNLLLLDSGRHPKQHHILDERLLVAPEAFVGVAHGASRYDAVAFDADHERRRADIFKLATTLFAVGPNVATCRDPTHQLRQVATGEVLDAVLKPRAPLLRGERP